MVQLGLDAVLSGTPSTICKTKVAAAPGASGPCRAPRPRLTQRRAGSQVVCTLGPKSRSVEVLEELLRAGLNVARFNFSHGSHEYHQARPPAGNSAATMLAHRHRAAQPRAGRAAPIGPGAAGAAADTAR
jgi:hypothetical protein